MQSPPEFGPIRLGQRVEYGIVSGVYGRRNVTVHGHEVAYRRAGSGEVVVLIHGLAGNSRTWQDVMPAL